MTFFIAVDGDDVGPGIRAFVVANDIDGAAKYSSDLQQYFVEIAQALEQLGAIIVFSGGDSVLATASRLPGLDELKSLYHGPCTISIGIGGTAETAYLALQLAKARGKNQVVLIDDIHKETIFRG